MMRRSKEQHNSIVEQKCSYNSWKTLIFTQSCGGFSSTSKSSPRLYTSFLLRKYKNTNQFIKHISGSHSSIQDAFSLIPCLNPIHWELERSVSTYTESSSPSQLIFCSDTVGKLIKASMSWIWKLPSWRLGTSMAEKLLAWSKKWKSIRQHMASSETSRQEYRSLIRQTRTYNCMAFREAYSILALFNTNCTRKTSN